MKNIKMKILHIIETIKKFSKDALNVDKKFFYFVVFIISFFLFTILLFPFNNIAVNYINSKKYTQFKSVSVEYAEFNFIKSTIFSGINLIFLNNNTLSITDIKTDLSILKVYFTKKFDGNFNINKFLFMTDKMNFSGMMSLKCNFKLDKKYNPLAGEVILSGENINLDGVSIRGFEFEKIKITSINSKFNFENNIISIKEFMFSGKELSGKIKVNIRLNSNFRNSTVNLEIDISAASSILKDFEMFLNQYINPDSNSISINITGTISTPSVNLKKSL